MLMHQRFDQMMALHFLSLNDILHQLVFLEEFIYLSQNIMVNLGRGLVIHISSMTA